MVRCEPAEWDAIADAMHDEAARRWTEPSEAQLALRDAFVAGAKASCLLMIDLYADAEGEVN